MKAVKILIKQIQEYLLIQIVAQNIIPDQNLNLLVIIYIYIASPTKILFKVMFRIMLASLSSFVIYKAVDYKIENNQLKDENEEIKREIADYNLQYKQYSACM